jgi:hypothetical protein
MQIQFLKAMKILITIDVPQWLLLEAPKIEEVLMLQESSQNDDGIIVKSSMEVSLKIHICYLLLR